MKKKVSIIMGIYNCSQTLNEAIESIINQSYKNWELIMCDDASSDNTYEIAKAYENRYPEQIKVLRNLKNLTLGPTLNRCLEVAKGEYIARQDGDDLSHWKRIEKQVDFLESNLEYDLVATNMYSYSDGKILGVRKNKFLIPKKEDTVKRVPFFHATILLKKDVYDKLGGYSLKKTRKRVEDVDLWFRFFKNSYKGYNLQEALYYVREDGGQYKRRGLKNYLNATLTCLNGVKLLKLSPKYYLHSFCILLKYFVPTFLKKRYHSKKVEV